jgi:hypothetical protein
MAKAHASYVDTLRLICGHPKIGLRMIAQVFSEGSDIRLGLGKSLSGAPDISDIRAFNLMSVVFPYCFNLAVLCLAAVSAALVFLISQVLPRPQRRLLEVGLFLSAFGFSQYAFALGDGFYELRKHLVVGNYSLALAAAFLLPALAQAAACFLLKLKKHA